MDLTVIVPSLDQADQLRAFLPQLKLTLSALNCPYEIIVIDAHRPSQQSKALCKELEVGYCRRPHGNDYGEAIRFGILAAKGNYLLCIHADGSHSLPTIAALWAERHQADVVIASRPHIASNSGHSLIAQLRSLIAPIQSLLHKPPKGQTGLRSITDPHSPFRLYRSATLKPLTLNRQNHRISKEILEQLQRLPYVAIKEVPMKLA
jgi:glycosyltransferase involved in cell wall biosynthesis